MSIRIRLSRGGAKKRPYYRVVIADSRSPRDGRYIERVGTYDPMLPKESGERVKLNEERIKYWLGVGAQPSDRVSRFLADANMGEKPTVPEQTKQHLPKAKAQECLKEAADAANSPAKEAVAEEAVAEEAVAEEAVAEEAPAS